MPLLLILLLGGGLLLLSKSTSSSAQSAQPVQPSAPSAATIPILTGHRYGFTATMLAGGSGFSIANFLASNGWDGTQGGTVTQASSAVPSIPAFDVENAVRTGPNTTLSQLQAGTPFQITHFREMSPLPAPASVPLTLQTGAPYSVLFSEPANTSIGAASQDIQMAGWGLTPLPGVPGAVVPPTSLPGTNNWLATAVWTGPPTSAAVEMGGGLGAVVNILSITPL